MRANTGKMTAGKTAILGVGFLGASFALALREKGLCARITGFGRDQANLKRAVRAGIIDDFSLEAARAVHGADTVVFATPPGSFLALARKVAGSLKKDSLQIDLGSVKGDLVRRMERILPSFVGCHPIAGGEGSGIEAAGKDLFKNARCVITRTSNTPDAACVRAIRLWKALGSEPVIMDPALHDKVYALMSHLPHLLAYALMNTVSGEDPAWAEFAGNGFKDSTRIALSPPALWSDIARLNRENLLHYLRLYKKSLSEIEAGLKKNTRSGKKTLFKTLERAQKLRARLESSGR